MAKKKKIKIIGKLSKNKKGFGFVIPTDESEDVFISPPDINGAMNGDLVEVVLIPEYLWKNKREGVIVGVKERNLKEVVGTYQRSKHFGFVIPAKQKNGDDIFIDKKFSSGAKDGDKVVAKIIKYPDAHNSAEGKVVQIISKAGQPGADIKELIRYYNIYESFPSKASAEAKAISKIKISDDEISKRRDLRNKMIFTIDGKDSKDFDDAVSCEKMDNGNFLLGVHIADVSHYIKENKHLDKEALKRGNSIYLIDQVIPMLPVELSNGVCSLNPMEDRLTLTCEVEIDDKGKILSHNVYESIICSKERMNYTDVSDIIEGKAGNLEEKYDHILPDIMLMDKLAKLLNKEREARGSIDFDLDESHIMLNKEGIPVNIEVAERRVANKLIEEFMLVANAVIAEHFFWLEAPFVYRVHEPPEKSKIEELAMFLKSFGITIRKGADITRPQVLAEILKKVKGQTYENVINTVILRTMQKARYSEDCKGHFGLALHYYCHFTSPIRRYSDLIIHRIIKDCITEKMDSKKIKEYKKKVKEAAEKTSITEREAIELERDVDKMKKAEYMSYHIGETYEGVISGVTNFGIYVELPNTIEGMIRMECLDDDYYEYEREKYHLIGKTKKKTYTLGDKIKIKVASVKTENKEIDFSLC